jgi:5-formyltetrahydrofolate cyclo-ligase
MSQSSATDALKADLRRRARAHRDALAPEIRAAASQAIAQRPFPISVRTGVVVSGFIPIRSELNPIPLMRKLADAGAQLALPAVRGPGQPLVMRAFIFGDTLTPGVWGIREPAQHAPELAPDILLVPLLCFDRSGHRIGYGAGYYDMTITALRDKKSAVAVGMAFAVQETEHVPKTARDARLDLVLTERETIDFRDS